MIIYNDDRDYPEYYCDGGWEEDAERKWDAESDKYDSEKEDGWMFEKD